jgi:hypothetical protein
MLRSFVKRLLRASIIALSFGGVNQAGLFDFGAGKTAVNAASFTARRRKSAFSDRVALGLSLQLRSNISLNVV